VSRHRTSRAIVDFVMGLGRQWKQTEHDRIPARKKVLM
jgi:hypothetical protein